MKSNIFLYGPPGVGKSASGLQLAKILGLTFIDLDQKIEEAAGIQIPAIFERDGEAGFRQLESMALAEVINQPASVVALGGGALLDPQNRQLVEQNGNIVCLTASLDDLTNRLTQQKGQRPLLLNGSLAELLDMRQLHYNSFPLSLHTDNLTAQQCAQAISVLLGIFPISGMGPDYTVHVGSGILRDLADRLITAGLQQPLVLVSDSNVARYYAAAILDTLSSIFGEIKHISFPAGENNKSLDTLTNIWDQLLQNQMDRHGTIIALGGGVANDMVGFAASTFMRGVPWVTLPTSLLAMVDASIGGKTGINLPSGKNLIGAFHPPKLVLADIDTLSTLPQEEVISGMAEVVKHAIIDDPALFDQCCSGIPKSGGEWSIIVKKAIAVKINIIQQDPYEHGRRAALNLGHTIGHALEKLSNYSIRHGEAVAIGTVAEARLAERIGLATTGLAEKIATVLTTIGLPIAIPEDMDRHQILKIMQYDKKRKGKELLFALPATIGDVRTGIMIERLPEYIKEL